MSVGGEPADPRRGALFMVAASFGFALLAVLVKLVAVRVPPGEIVMWRSLVTAGIMLVVSVRSGASIRPVNVPMHAVRAAVGLGSMVCYFNAIARLPAGDAVLLTYLSPLIVAALAPLTGERPPVRVWFALVLGIGGVALVVGPASTDDHVGIALALCAALFAAMAYLSVKVLTRTDTPTAIVWWFSALGALFGSVAAVDGVAPLDGYAVGLLLGIGALGACAQWALTRAYGSAPAAQVSVYAYATPLFAYLLGAMVLRELPPLTTAIGACVVVTAGALAARS